MIFAQISEQRNKEGKKGGRKERRIEGREGGREGRKKDLWSPPGCVVNASIRLKSVVQLSATEKPQE